MLSDGTLKDISARCDVRGLVDRDLSRCKQLLSAVPGSYRSLNQGLQTLQFQSLSVNPRNSKNIQGGTQDNGTFETQGSVSNWPQTIFGDGGLSGFDATNDHFRFHTYFAQQPEVSFRDGASVVVELHRRPAVRGVGAVLLPDHLRPGGLGDALLRAQPRLAHAGRRWPAGVPRAALQRVHR